MIDHNDMIITAAERKAPGGSNKNKKNKKSAWQDTTTYDNL